MLATDLWSAYSYSIFLSHKGEVRDSYYFLKSFVIGLSYLTIPITCSYMAYLLVGPQLFEKKKYVPTAIFTILTLVIAVTLRYSLEYYFFLPVFGFDNYKGHPWPFYDFVSNVFFYYFPRYFIYGLMYFFAENWYKSKHLQQRLQKERSVAELAFLRSQVNPHFLFNTINDIYSLVYQKSDQAPVALLKLSDILRYMLREGAGDMTSLKQEVKYLENLIELQQISAKGNVYIDFKVEGYIGEQNIASVLLISFVENAFKHGILTDPENPVQIHLTVSRDRSEFTVINKKNTYQKDKTSGIGLNNVLRRLELLYPGKHQLDINDQNGIFSVNLKLKQAS